MELTKVTKEKIKIKESMPKYVGTTEVMEKKITNKRGKTFENLKEIMQLKQVI